MSFSRRHLPAAASFAVATFLPVTGSHAEELRWTIASELREVLHLEFYSQSYDRSWPGAGEVWVLDREETYVFNLACEPGELICFGAWLRDDTMTYWGAGPDGGQSCADCCASCGEGEVSPIRLTR